MVALEVLLASFIANIWLNADNHSGDHRQSAGTGKPFHLGRDDASWVCLFEAILGILRIFIFTHTARRLDLGYLLRYFVTSYRLPLAYFEARRVGDTAAVCRSWKISVSFSQHHSDCDPR